VELEPDSALLPLHPPEAVQLAALATLHVRVAAVPLTMLLGLALNDTTGAG
jgi:hypothetical protein